MIQPDCTESEVRFITTPDHPRRQAGFAVVLRNAGRRWRPQPSSASATRNRIVCTDTAVGYWQLRGRNPLYERFLRM